jgi:hypothetical protein
MTSSTSSYVREHALGVLLGTVTALVIVYLIVCW